MSTHKKKEIDAEIGNALIEIKRGESSLRAVRTSLMQVAYRLSEQPEKKGYLVLIDSRITKPSLKTEWQQAVSVLKGDITQRLSLCILEGNRFTGLPHDPDLETQGILSKAVAEEPPRPRVRGVQGNASFIVMKILLYRLINDGGPVTTEWLSRMSGFSYPTIAMTLHSLGSLIERKSDRRLRLKWLPRREYSRLSAMASQTRSTVRFADRSGQPRSVEYYIKRLEKLVPPGLAIGGVLGAKHYFPDLDIMGAPRLDLSAHCPDGEMDLKFVNRLDPALQRVEDPLAPASLAVHAVRHRESLFISREGGLSWADQIECLLDLHEAGLEMQENEFFRHLEVHVQSAQFVKKLIDEY